MPVDGLNESSWTIANTGSGQANGYVDAARCLSVLNAKECSQTVRKKGKYIPQTFLTRITLQAGDAVGVSTMPNSYPIRNAVVMAGWMRDGMLKQNGVKRSDLNTYDKELRVLMDKDQATDGSEDWLPNGSDPGTVTDDHAGTDDDVWGLNRPWDVTQLVHADDAGDNATTRKMAVLGNTNPAGVISLVRAWRLFRNSFDPSDDAAKDRDGASLFGKVMNSIGTQDEVALAIDDEGSETPYSLEDFETKVCDSILYSNGGQGSITVSAPLGLFKVQLPAGTIARFEVLGIADM